MTSGPGAGQSIPVEDQVVIGREDADLTISDPEVSRRHAVVRPTQAGVAVEDLGSMNGTFVNGARISGAVALNQTGTIRIGPTEITVEIAPQGAPVAEGLQSTRVSGSPVQPDAAPPLAPTAAPPGEPPAAAAGPARGGRGRPPKAVLGVVAALVVAGVTVGLIIALSSGSSAKKDHPFSATVITALYSPPAQVIDIMAVVQGDPVGDASALISRTTTGLPSPGGPPLPLTLHIIISEPEGSFTSDLAGTTMTTKTGKEVTSGTAKVTSGTGIYKGITGSFTLAGGGQFAFAQPGLTNTSTFKVNGTLTY